VCRSCDQYVRSTTTPPISLHTRIISSHFWPKLPAADEIRLPTIVQVD